MGRALMGRAWTGGAPAGKRPALADGGEQAVGAALPEGADLGEARRAQRAGVHGQPRALRAVVTDGAALALGDRAGQRRVGRDRLPPLLPVLAAAIAAREAAVVLALFQHPVQAGQHWFARLVEP